MGHPAIRSYVQGDIEDIVRIYNEAFKNLASCWPNPMTLEWFMERFGSTLKDKTGIAFIAEHEKIPVGYVLVTTAKRPEVGLVAYISGICVAPGFQRRGIGTELLQKAVDWARNQAVVVVENDDEIVENAGAVAFFEKMGFEVFHRGACMSKDLWSDEGLSVPRNVSVRELKDSDLDDLLNVRKETFRELGPWYSVTDDAKFKMGMRNRIGRDDVKVFVAVKDGKLIGYVVCQIRKDNEVRADIRNISVLPGYRNMRVGSALIANAYDYLRESKVKTVSTVTETAEPFYRKVGFKVDARFVRVRKLLTNSIQTKKQTL